MSRHFFNGTIYDAYSDTGPGTILVDPFATIITAAGSSDALTHNGGTWDITISGVVCSLDGTAVHLTTPGFVSNIRIKAGGDVFGHDFGIRADHPTNITNAGRISDKENIDGIWENNDGDFTIKNLKSGIIEGGTEGIAITGLGTHRILNAGTIANYDISRNAIVASIGIEGIEKVTNWGVIK